jgi:hypothetical protein
VTFYVSYVTNPMISSVMSVGVAKLNNPASETYAFRRPYVKK